MGTVFLRKFQFVFDEDSRKIGFYRQFQENKEDNNNNGNDNDNNNQNITKTVVIIILIIIKNED